MNLSSLKSKLKYRLKQLSFIKAVWSPFKPLYFKWYFGKTAVGVPYFYPRRWIKATPKLAHEAALEYIKRKEQYNKLNPDSAREIRPYEEVYKEKMRYEYAVTKKIGFDFVGLGWKTKWSDTDYRFEWSPVWSFVFFKWQIAVTVVAPEMHHYWEAWLYYENHTDKTKSKRERIAQCRAEFSRTCTVHYKGSKEETVDYYDKILRKKYL